MEPKKDADPKKPADDKKDADPKKAMLAELDLPALNAKRAKEAERQKKTTEWIDTVKILHLSGFWLGGISLLGLGIAGPYLLPEDHALQALLPYGAVLGLAMAIMAFVAPSVTLKKLQDEAKAAEKQVAELDRKIAFFHLVDEEAKKVKIRKYAEVWADKPPAPAAADKKATAGKAASGS
jgi:hypothetical protein